MDGDHIAGAVDRGIPAEAAELFQKPGGALLLQKVGAGTRQSCRWISLIHCFSRVNHCRHRARRDVRSVR